MKITKKCDIPHKKGDDMNWKFGKIFKDMRDVIKFQI